MADSRPSADLQAEYMDLYAKVEEAQLGITSIRQRLKKNPEDPALQTQLSAAKQIVATIRLKRDMAKKALTKAQRREEELEQETKESERKNKLFEIFDILILKYRLCVIPEFYRNTNPWINVRWWDTNKKDWLEAGDNPMVIEDLRSQVSACGYINDKLDMLEFNAYIQRHMPVHWDQWDKYLYFQNGVLVNNHLVVNHPQFYTKFQYPFRLLSQEELALRVDRPFLRHRFAQVTDQWEEICWWVGHALRQSPMEYFFFFLGPPSGGKTPWASVIRALFGKIGTDPIDGLGEKGGLGTWWDKRINIDFDANIAYLPNVSIAKIKQIFGDDPEQNVRLLFQNPFQVKILPYLIVLINTMPKINQGINVNALFKRARICEFNHQLNDDPDFKEMIKDPEFIDLFGSVCYWKSFEETLENGDYCNRRKGRLIEFMEDTKLLWQDSAYPVRKAIMFLLRRSIQVEDEIDSRELSAVVQCWFNSKEHNRLQVSVPTNLAAEITEAVSQLGGDKCMRNKRKAYEGVYWTEKGLDFLAQYRKGSKATVANPIPPTEPSDDWFGQSSKLNELKQWVKAQYLSLCQAHAEVITFTDLWEIVATKEGVTQAMCLEVFEKK